MYAQAIDLGLGDGIVFAQLHTIRGTAPGHDAARCYSPAVCTGTDVKVVRDDPDPSRISTS